MYILGSCTRLWLQIKSLQQRVTNSFDILQPFKYRFLVKLVGGLPELPQHALCLVEDERRIRSTADSGFYTPLCSYRIAFLQV